MGVLVCMVMEKLLGRAPGAPPAFTARAQPLHALPGSQVPSSAGLQLYTGLPFPVTPPEPAPTHQMMSWPSLASFCPCLQGGDGCPGLGCPLLPGSMAGVMEDLLPCGALTGPLLQCSERTLISWKLCASQKDRQTCLCSQHIFRQVRFLVDEFRSDRLKICSC